MEELHRRASLVWLVCPARLDARSAAARARRARRRRIRDARTHPAPPWDADAALARAPVRGGDLPAPARVRVADRGDRRGGALQLSHAPARPDRRSRAALPARGAQWPDAEAPARLPAGRADARAREPPRRAADLGDQPLRLAPAVPLRGRGRTLRRACARAHLLLQRRHHHVAARAGDAAGAGVVRHRPEARLHRDRPRSSRRCSATSSSGRARSSTGSTSAATSSGASRRFRIRGWPGR